MYQEYFGLNSKPFGIVPDTRFLFLSNSHREAIAHLIYALNEKNGFVQLTGEVGTGKTMACRHILTNIPDDIDVALILNPRIDESGLLRTLCQEMGITYNNDQQPNELTQLLNDKLLQIYAANRHTILIIDEAQNLPKRTLEQLRLLTNLETNTQKLLRIILIGQPELGDLLAEHDMRQVAQRITSRYHLTTLSQQETDDYIHHRLKIAGCDHRVFSNAASRAAYKLTEGTPRLLNLLCDRALIAAYSKGEHEVSASLIKKAAKEALPYVKVESTHSNYSWVTALLLLVVIASAALFINPQWRAQISQYWLASPPGGIADQTEAGISTETVLEAPTLTSKSVTTPLANGPSTISIQSGSTKTPPPVPEEADHPDGLSAAQLEKMRKQADVDFRMGIPIIAE